MATWVELHEPTRLVQEYRPCRQAGRISHDALRTPQSSVMLVATDGDGDTLTFAVIDGPAHGTPSGMSPNADLHACRDYHGCRLLLYMVSDATASAARHRLRRDRGDARRRPARGYERFRAVGSDLSRKLAAINATFSDTDVGDIHTALFTWEDGITSTGTVDEPAGTGQRRAHLHEPASMQ